MNKIKLVLVTGVAGAGKTTFASVCEENGYHVIEEFPTSMIPSLLELFKNEPETYSHVALFVNIAKVDEAAKTVRSDDSFASSLVGLDCQKEVLLTRFRLTRHIHPLQPKGYSLIDAIDADAKKMSEARPLFDFYIDTTGLREKDFRKKASAILSEGDGKIHLMITSFGYKFGLPCDAEIVIDARCLVNPYWVPELSRLTGLDQPVADFIAKDPKTGVFLEKLYSLLDDYLSQVVEDGRSFVMLDVGCSGGQHRSVFVAEQLQKHYQNQCHCIVCHREISRYVEDEKE